MNSPLFKNSIKLFDLCKKGLADRSPEEWQELSKLLNTLPQQFIEFSEKDPEYDDYLWERYMYVIKSCMK